MSTYLLFAIIPLLLGMYAQFKIKSAYNIFLKKSKDMEQDEIKQYLMKKGYRQSSIKQAVVNGDGPFWQPAVDNSSGWRKEVRSERW